MVPVCETLLPAEIVHVFSFWVLFCDDIDPLCVSHHGPFLRFGVLVDHKKTVTAH